MSTLKQEGWLVNIRKYAMIEIINQLIIDYVQIYAVGNNLKENMVALSNYAKMHKKIILPCKLVGMCGNNISYSSSFKQLAPFLSIPKPSNNSLETQKEFSKWLSPQKKIALVTHFNT